MRSVSKKPGTARALAGMRSKSATLSQKIRHAKRRKDSTAALEKELARLRAPHKG